MEIVNQLIDNYEVLVMSFIVLVGVIKRDVLKLAWDIDRDGDVDVDDVKKIVSGLNLSSLVRIVDNTKNLDAKYMDVIYALGDMREDDARAFLCAMSDLASVPASDRDALVKAVTDGNIRDIDFILENANVPQLKALATIFRQLAMTSFLTGKDPSPDMKERIYQAMKIAVSGDTADLDEIKSILAV